MNSSLIAAAVQFKPKKADIDNNIVVARQLAFEAAVKGAKIIVLPELSISGNDIDEHEALICSQKIDGYQTKEFYDICIKYKTIITFGYVEFYQGSLYNSAVTIGEFGPLLNVRKTNLEGNDFIWAKSYKYPQRDVALYEQFRIGSLISHDALYKGQEYYRDGMIDCLCVPSSLEENASFPDARLVNLSEDIRTNVIFSNQSSNKKNTSYIVDKSKKVWINSIKMPEGFIVGGTIKI